MKNVLLSCSIIFLFTNCNNPKPTYEDSIKQFQYKLNTQYANAEESPLTKEDVLTFKSLDFFNIDENYQVEAELELTPSSRIFEMKTTTDRLPLFKKYAIAHFTINNQKCSLSLYESQDFQNTLDQKNMLFLPYNDQSNGELSYSGGRFIDIDKPSEVSLTIIIDFNKSYNPYCAYNHKYSCPIPPSENNLPVSILAGEKSYNKKH